MTSTTVGLEPSACFPDAEEPSGLLTDAYELTMAVSYFRHGLNPTSTFSLFARRLPPERGFLVAAGIEDCVDFLLGLRFTAEDLEFVSRALGVSSERTRRPATLRFSGDLRAVPEGRVVLANEPLLEVTAPLVEAQLAETFLLNRITFQTTLASKAVRCVLAAQGAHLVDFAMRRTQGLDAAMQIARLSALVGFSGTSNCAAARRYGIPALGTMAHSYVQAFPSEAAASRAFADDFPTRCTLLVDTYDTLEGVRAAAAIVRSLGLPPGTAVRLDSGDLDSLSRQARRILDDEGVRHVRIFASGGLDEYRIDDLVRAGAPIDAYGVGTKLGVSADAPYLDTAYKLVEVDGQPVMKLSTGKITLPGAKQVYRSVSARGTVHDQITLGSAERPIGAEALLVPFVIAGRRVREPGTMQAASARLRADLAQLAPSALRIRRPRAPAAEVADPLQRLADQVAASLSGRRSGGATNVPLPVCRPPSPTSAMQAL